VLFRSFLFPAIAIAVQCLSRKSEPVEIASSRKRGTSPLDGQLSSPERMSFLHRFVRPGFRGNTADAVSFLMLFVAASLCFGWLLSSAASDDDGQAVRYRAQAGSFVLTVFAQPGDLSTGSADVGILVQDGSNQEVVLDATIDVTAKLHASVEASSIAHASHEDSQNKLLQTAELKLPKDGDWTLNFNVRHGSEVADFPMPLHVAKADTDFEVPWPYIAIGVFWALLALIYLRRHFSERTTKSKKHSTALPMPSPAASARSPGSRGSA
jgi:hypothetical protein